MKDLAHCLTDAGILATIAGALLLVPPVLVAGLVATAAGTRGAQNPC